MNLYPDARLARAEAPGALPAILSFEGDDYLPNYSGLVYALLAGRSYILWRDVDQDGKVEWDVVNAGHIVVAAELDRFIARRVAK